MTHFEQKRRKGQTVKWIDARVHFSCKFIQATNKFAIGNLYLLRYKTRDWYAHWMCSVHHTTSLPRQYLKVNYIIAFVCCIETQLEQTEHNLNRKIIFYIFLGFSISLVLFTSFFYFCNLHPTHFRLVLFLLLYSLPFSPPPLSRLIPLNIFPFYLYPFHPFTNLPM